MPITRLLYSDSKNQMSEAQISLHSKKYYQLLSCYDVLIDNCDKIKNPLIRIRELKNLDKKLNKIYKKINADLCRIPATKNIYRTLVTKEELLKNLKDLRVDEYKQFKDMLIRIFKENIRAKLSKAELENAFDQTFYVYQNNRGKVTNQPQSVYQYFLGVPSKEQPKLFYYLDWLSYIGGGFLMIPIKNTIKWFIEFIPNYMMNVFYNNLENLKPTDSSLYFLLNILAFSYAKLIHILGRAVASPLTSAKIGYEWAQDICAPIHHIGLKKAAGVILGVLFALPSLAIGIATILFTILFVPTSIIWVVGKLPLFGLEAAAWLTSTGQTLGGLHGVATFTSNNLSIATKIAPAFVTEASVGIGAFSQFVMFGQKALKLPELFLKLGQNISQLFGFKPKKERAAINPLPRVFEDVPNAYRLSYTIMKTRGLLIKDEEEKLRPEQFSHTPSNDQSIKTFEIPESEPRDSMGTRISSTTGSTGSFKRK